MSLVRLLTAGKSLVGARDDVSRYRVRKHVVLPKFISPKNPFASTTVRDTLHPKGASGSLGVRQPTKIQPAQAEPNGAALVMPAVETQPSASTGRPRLPHPVRKLFEKFNPLPLIAGLKPAPKPVRAALVQAPVQGELSLDHVKVVRNDLSDADLEVVPMKSATTDAQPSTDLQVAMKSPSASPSWEQWTARLFRAGQT